MREKNIEKAQKEAKVRARKEGAKSIYSQDAREVHVPDDIRVSIVVIIYIKSLPHGDKRISILGDPI